MKRKLKVGSSSQIVPIRIDDTNSTTGEGLTGLVYNSSGLTARYKRRDQTAWQTLTLAAPLGIGQWVSGGFQELGRGVYELSLPNLVLQSGSWVIVQLYGATNMADVNLEIELDAVDYQDDAAFGLSCLDTTIGSRLADADYTVPPTASDLWSYASRTLSDKTDFSLVAGEHTLIQADVTAGLTAQGYTPTRAGYLDILNGLVANIWSYGNRTLSSFGTLVSEVWTNVSRTLTDKTGYSLASSERAAIAGVVDTQLSSTHGAGTWTQAAIVGAHTVTVVVRSQATSGVLAGVRVTLKDATDSTALDQKWTDSSGIVQFTVDAATYQVHLGNVAGYESLTAQELVVTSSSTATYYLSPLAISTPTDPALCVVYGYVYQNGVPVVGTDVTAKLTTKGAIADEILLSIQTLTDTTDTSGYFELELVRSDQFTVGAAEYKIAIEATGINQVVEIPNQESVNLVSLLKPQL